MEKKDALGWAIIGFAHTRHAAETGPWTATDVLEGLEPDKSDSSPEERVFSAASVYRSLTALLKEGHITETGVTDTGESGRPATLYEITPPGQEYAAQAGYWAMGLLVLMPPEAQEVIRRVFTEPAA